MHPIVAENARLLDLCRCEILGFPIDFIDYHTAFEIIQGWRASKDRQFIVIATPHDVQLSRDSELRAASIQAGLNLPDGVGVVVAARLLGYRTSGRVTGAELMLRVCDWGRKYGYRHYFYGSTEDVVRKLEERLTQQYAGLKIVGSYCPPFRALTPREDEAVVRHINSCQPDILWVGLGAPKQQLWMADHLGRIAAPVMIGVGAAFNFHSGVVKWAPLWMRRLGMEWIYRTIVEPRKIVPRARHTFLFGVRVVVQAVAWRFARLGGLRGSCR